MKVDPNVYYMWETAKFLSALAQPWTLTGLVVWLVFYGKQKAKHPFVALFVTLLCGPAAMIVAAWMALTRRPVIAQPKTSPPEPWIMSNGRN